MTPKLSKEQIAKIRRQRIEAAQQHDGYEFEDDWKDLDEQAGAQPPPGHPEDQPDVYPPPSAPFEVAQQLYGQYRKDGARLGNGRRKDGVRTLLAWRGGWMLWRGTHWAEIDTAELRSYIYTTLDKAVYEKATKSGIELVPWEPSRRKIGDVLEAMAAVGHLAKDIDPPSWVVHITAESPPGQMISCANGLLDLSKRQLTDHTPALFNHVHVPFDYDSDAGDPAIWLDFLASVWDDDHDSIALLQQYFGYILSGRLEQQKLMMLVGPTRSGKGTIARTLMALIGPRNVANPTMASLSTNFGLMPLIGKPLAIVSDARLGNTPADA
ncbi:MAG TPA: hypothetical protein VN203_18135, partial [Candidatus Acidoferrum sp.]|nr:hypothetical protein [Candidatus Acidoferrum sp.]